LWAGGPRRLQKTGTEHRDFRQLIEDLILRLSKEELELFWVHCLVNMEPKKHGVAWREILGSFKMEFIGIGLA